MKLKHILIETLYKHQTNSAPSRVRVAPPLNSVHVGLEDCHCKIDFSLLAIIPKHTRWEQIKNQNSWWLYLINIEFAK